MGVCLITETELGWILGGVFVGGVLGGVLRYSVAAWVTQIIGSAFPWGTLVVNASGSLLIGLLAGWLWSDALLVGSDPLALPAWAPVVAGLLGSYTTVSAFSLQTVDLWQAGRRTMAAFNVLLSVGLTLALAALGWILVRGPGVTS